MTGAQRRTSGVSRGRIHESHDSWPRERAGLSPLPGARSHSPPLRPDCLAASVLTQARAFPFSIPVGLAHLPPISHAQGTQPRSPPTTGEPWRACALRRGRSLPRVSVVRFWGRWLQAPSPHPGVADLELHFPPTTGPRLNFAVLGSV